METKYHQVCYLCGSKQIERLKGYEEHQLAKCSKCSFVFMHRIPTSKELSDYYSVYVYQNEKEVSEATRFSMENLVKQFEPYRKNNRILDVGCGEGWILEIARKNNWNVYGTEYSPSAIKICEAKGIKMYAGILDPAKMDISEFDVILSLDTVEHIYNPKEDFGNINKLLREGGLLYITTPNFNSYLRHMLKTKYNIIKYPEHLGYYTKKTLNLLLTNAGFRKDKLLTTGISLTRLQDSLNNAAHRYNEPSSPDEKLRKKIVKSKGLRIAKDVVNRMLTVFGLGMTLKGYYIKK